MESLFNSGYCEIFKNTYFEEQLRTAAASEKWNRKKYCSYEIFILILKKQVKMFVFISWKKQVKMLVFVSWLVSFRVCIQIQYLCDVVSKLPIPTWVNQKKIKSSRKEYVLWTWLNFDQWQTFSENSKPMRVWLWFVYKFTENYCRLRLFSEFIQTQKRYPTSLD